MAPACDARSDNGASVRRPTPSPPMIDSTTATGMPSNIARASLRRSVAIGPSDVHETIRTGALVVGNGADRRRT